MIAKNSSLENLIWLTTKEAAEYLRISEGNLRVKISRGQIIPSGKLDGRWRFLREELDRLLKTPTQGDFYA